MKYRKKPVVVEAVQFDGVPTNDPPGVWRRDSDLSPYVVTIHAQRVYLSPGDWIIPEPDGIHFYPVKPDVFVEMYEPDMAGGPMSTDTADHHRSGPGAPGGLLYIAGPMTGLPEFNYPAFERARGELEAVGFSVLCPVDNDPDPATSASRSWEWYLRRALRQVLDADGIAVLPDAACSRGACLEIHVARALGMTVQPVTRWIAEASHG